MKIQLSPDLLPAHAVLLTCSSHEDRCEGLLNKMSAWSPSEAVVFHYDDINQKREVHHKHMLSVLKNRGLRPATLQFTEANAVKSLRDNMISLKRLLVDGRGTSIVLDISVFTKRHLLMLLRWLDDEGYWDRVCIVYSEPQEYDVSQFIPLSFGISSFQQIPGFSACPDLSPMPLRITE